MNTHNFTLCNLDTDAISICYPDMRPIPTEEQTSLLGEINSILPELIQMDHDGYYQTVIIVRTKNYVMYDGKKIKIKGSGLRASTKCASLKNMIKESIEIMCYATDDSQMKIDLQNMYSRYVKQAATISSGEEMKIWSARKTYTQKINESQRTNETKVLAALQGSNYVEGDRMFVYYMPDDSLSLAENFTGEYNKSRLYKNIYDTISVFDTVLPVKELFLNYALKKNLPLVENL